MANATFRKGDYKTRKHTAASDISAGDVELLGNTAGLTNGIAHADIANGAVGTLAIGGGIYEMLNLNNAADGEKVYYDPATPTKVTTVSTNNSMFGFITENGGGGANSSCLVLHHPYV